MSGIDIGSEEDFPDREMKQVVVGGTEIGVCRWGQQIYAFRNRCPHEGAPLCKGFLQKKLSATLVEAGPKLEVSEDEPVVLCPWHRWEFQLSDGAAVWPGFKMRTYPVIRDNGRVLISVGRSTSNGA